MPAIRKKPGMVYESMTGIIWSVLIKIVILCYLIVRYNIHTNNLIDVKVPPDSILFYYIGYKKCSSCAESMGVSCGSQRNEPAVLISANSRRTSCYFNVHVGLNSLLGEIRIRLCINRKNFTGLSGGMP